LYFSISAVVQMEMSWLSVVMGTSPCARQWLDPVVPCTDGTKDEDHTELHDMLSLGCELELWLDRPDESACFAPLSSLLILHITCNNNTQTKVPSTLGVSISVSQTGITKKRLCRELARDEASKKTSLT
jgi:hypothetical protein